jgi:phosphatidylglycerophosphate synthase
MADRAHVTATLVVLLTSTSSGLMVATIVTRELLVSGLRRRRRTRGVTPPATWQAEDLGAGDRRRHRGCGAAGAGSATARRWTPPSPSR